MKKKIKSKITRKTAKTGENRKTKKKGKNVFTRRNNRKASDRPAVQPDVTRNFYSVVIYA